MKFITGYLKHGSQACKRRLVSYAALYKVIFWAMLCCAACYGQTQFLGIQPGSSTRDDVSKVLGQPVRQLSAALFEYNPQAGTGKIEVEYRAGAQVVERVEVYFLQPILRSALIQKFNLPAQADVKKSNKEGKLVEYFRNSALSLTYGTSIETGGVVSLGCYSRGQFDGATGGGDSADAKTKPSASEAAARIEPPPVLSITNQKADPPIFFRGLVPQLSTRVDAEKVLGQPVRQLSATVFEYPAPEDFRKIEVEYRCCDSDQVERVDRIEVHFLQPILRQALIQKLHLRTQADWAGLNAQGKRLEYFAVIPALFLTYASGDEAGGIVGIGYCGSIYAREQVGDLDTRKPRLGVTHESQARGLTVSGVTIGSPAERAGLRRGDVITSLNGVEFTTVADFREKLFSLPDGAGITLTIERGGQRQQLQATLGSDGGRSTPLIQPPSSKRLSYRHPRGLYEVSYPENWRVIPTDAGGGALLVPEGGVVVVNGHQQIIYGAIVGQFTPQYQPDIIYTPTLDPLLDARTGRVIRPRSLDSGPADPRFLSLLEATREMVSILMKSTANLQTAFFLTWDKVYFFASSGKKVYMAGAELAGPSPSTGRAQRVNVYARATTDGQIAYVILFEPDRDGREAQGNNDPLGGILKSLDDYLLRQ